MLNRINAKWALVVIGALLWVGLHVPSIRYGATDVPLYVTHVGDEQVPINGGLHVLNEKNLLALRDANKAYYGPLMVMLAVPAAAANYAWATVFEGVASPLQYRDHVIWDWGGILMFGRGLSVLIGFVGLVIFARILLLSEVNPPHRLWPVVLAVLLLATEYFFFHYTAHFRHWVFLITILLAQAYLYFLMRRNGFRLWRHWFIQAVLSVTTFGISYLGILFNIVWAPDFIKWIIQPRKNKGVLACAFAYGAAVLTGAAVMVWWHPYAFFRIIGIVGSDLSGDTAAPALEEHYGTAFSFDYYTDLFFNNHSALALAFVLLLAALWSARKRLLFVYPILSLLVIYFLLFGFQSHHSTHYFLPAIVLFHLLFGMALVAIANKKGGQWKKYLLPIVVFLIGIQLAFNSAVIYKLVGVLHLPPPETTLARLLVDMQERERGNVLLSGCGPLPVPHTRAAYADFASRAERYKTSLYSTMLSPEFPYPADVTLLDAYYDDNMPAGERLNSGDYDRVVVCHPFNPEGDPNRRLEHETKLFNYWDLSAYVDRFEFIYPPALRDTTVEGVVFR